MADNRRLIDANELAKEYQFTEDHTSPLTPWTITDILNILDEAPTVDAVEVVHGRWIETLVPDGYVQKASRMRKQCSVCGWTNACRYHYCPNCGAKMDGDGNA